MQPTGDILIGGGAVRGGGEAFAAVSPETGEVLAPPVASAGLGDVELACRLAAEAFASFRELRPQARAAFLDRVAEEIEALGDPLIERAMLETGLPRPRLVGERARTCGQLRLFAEELRRGDMFGVRIDRAQPERAPLPRPDLRQRMIPLGPVAVFGASNFPLAFSTAGGDTASALAAGCPVVVKGHPAHPGTAELVGRAVQKAVAACGLPEGVFALVTGPSNALGEALVRDPRIQAVGFTGSRAGGLALARIAAERPTPIPVFAEMSSVNPVFLLPGALDARAEALAAQFVASLTQGAGQFCTNPGLLMALDGPALDRFAAAAVAALAQSAPAVMLTAGIHAAYQAGVERLERHPGVRPLGRGCVGEGLNQARGALFETTAAEVRRDPSLAHEVFGSSALLVRCAHADELAALVGELEGQLTATLHMTDTDHALARRLLPALELRCGRILANGWPTGVEVAHAMVHGGPYPATTDGRSTSVGTLAVARFLRPVCYQDLPDALLPAAVQDANPLRLNRRIEGAMTAAHA